MEYIKIAQTEDLPVGSKQKISLKGRDILLVNIEDHYYAIDNTCTHMGGSLVDGNLDGFNIVCPKHGSAFDVRTGKVTGAGKLFFVKVKVTDLHAYPLKIEGSDILAGIE